MKKVNYLLPFVFIQIFYLSCAERPGLKVRLTQNGLNYVNRVTKEVAGKLIKNWTIPDVSEQDREDFSYRLSNIKIVDVPQFDITITLNPMDEGITIQVTNVYLSLMADYDITNTVFYVPMNYAGVLKITTSDTSLTIVIALEKDMKQFPQLLLKTCTAFIGELHLDFQEEGLLNLVESFFQNDLKELFTKKACQLIQEKIVVQASQKLKKLYSPVKIFSGFVLDLSVLQPITVTSQYLQSSNKGQFYWENDTSNECSFLPEPIPDDVDSSRMVYVWISDYVPQTLACIAHNHGFLQYTIFYNDLSEAQKHSFNKIFCESDDCVESKIPQMSQIVIKSIKVPEVQFNNQGLLTIFCGVNILTHDYAGNVETIVESQMTISIEVVVLVQSEVLSGNIEHLNVKLDQFNTSVENVDKLQFQQCITDVLNTRLLPLLNVAVKAAIKLPTYYDVTLKHPQVMFINRSFLISTDVMYKNII